ncbi:MAG: agmatine deiminase family protein [Bacteroidales bacterium]|nr:agmatine deiminase family protein [Bacteroidales bacterium]
MKRFATLLLITLILLNSGLIAQQVKDVPIWKKMHYLSEEEMKLPHDNIKNFVPTDPPAPPVRMVAEYEHMQSVLVRYPFGIPTALIVEMSQDCNVTTLVSSQSQQNTVTSIYQGSGANMNNIDFIQAPTDSYWTRDYGPWFVIDGNGNFGVCDFPYNRPRPNDDEVPVEVAAYLGIDLYGMPLEQTGGNWMCTGIKQGASTDLVWDENPGMSHTEIQQMVDDYLGVEQYHVLPDPLGEYIKHIDCWGKYLGMNKVLIGSVLESDPRYDDFEYVADYFANTISDWGVPYEVFRVYTPGYYPNTPYTNSLILNRKVFVPITGSPYDADALAVYEEAMPGYEVIGVMYDGWENTDALHCRAKGIADIEMLYIRHIPLLGDIQMQDQYEITASITNYSGSPLYADSVLLYYKTDGAYQPVQMTPQLGNNYKGIIPFQEEGTEVSYYIFAADESGKRSTHPFIGTPDPHVFTVVQNLPGIVSFPDTLLFTTINQAVDGLQVKIFPDGDVDAIIENINLEGTDIFYWIAEPLVTFPYSLAVGDSLVLTVYVPIPTDQGMGFLQDTMFIECEGGDEQVLIVVDEDIISALDEPGQNMAITAAYPNPFSDVLHFNVNLAGTTDLNVMIFNNKGSMVCTIAGGKYVSGVHTFSWDGRTDGGAACPAGIYYVVAKSSNGISSSSKVIRK